MRCLCQYSKISTEYWSLTHLGPDFSIANPNPSSNPNPNPNPNANLNARTERMTMPSITVWARLPASRTVCGSPFTVRGSKYYCEAEVKRQLYFELFWRNAYNKVTFQWRQFVIFIKINVLKSNTQKTWGKNKQSYWCISVRTDNCFLSKIPG